MGIDDFEGVAGAGGEGGPTAVGSVMDGGDEAVLGVEQGEAFAVVGEGSFEVAEDGRPGVTEGEGGRAGGGGDDGDFVSLTDLRTCSASQLEKRNRPEGRRWRTAYQLWWGQSVLPT